MAVATRKASHSLFLGATHLCRHLALLTKLGRQFSTIVGELACSEPAIKLVWLLWHCQSGPGLLHGLSRQTVGMRLLPVGIRLGKQTLPHHRAHIIWPPQRPT